MSETLLVPWSLEEEPAPYETGLFDSKGDCIAIAMGENHEALAAFIVRAANSHQELVEALDVCHQRLADAMHEIEHLRGWLDDSEREERRQQDEAADQRDRDVLAQAQAALARARGEAS